MPPNRVIFAKNPYSSRAAHGDVLIQKMQQSAGDRPYKTFTTQSSDVWQNIDDLAGVIQEDDVVVAVGGDGMAFTAYNAIIAAGRESASMAVLPAGGGNDSSRGLVSRLRHAPYVFETGEPRATHSLRLSAQFPDGTGRDWCAINYAGVGMSGRISRRLNQGIPRTLRNMWPGIAGLVVRKAADASVVIDDLLLKKSPTCIYERNGRLVHGSELMYINGASLAGTLRTGQSFEFPEITRVELTDSYMQRAKEIGLVVARNALHLPVQGDIIKSDNVQFVTPQVIQFDGEDMVIPGGTRLEVSSSQQTVDMWTSVGTPAA